MTNSILTSVKKTLGIAADYTAFDEDIIMHINSVFSTLQQLGVGPDNGFQISDAAAGWSDLLGTDPRLNNVKTYTYMRVRLMFDPPATSYLISSMQKQVEELEWRMNAHREETAWVNPLPPVPVLDGDLDGGDPSSMFTGSYDGGSP
jgi:hypothetical protein